MHADRFEFGKVAVSTTQTRGGAVAVGAGACGGCDGFRARSGGAVRGGVCSGSGGAVRAERLGGAVQTCGAPASRVGGVVICGHFQVEKSFANSPFNGIDM